MDSNIGKESKVLALENNIAVLAELAFSSGELSIMPRAFFWFGHMTNQTL